MKKLSLKLHNAFIFLYSLLIGVTPLLMYHKTSEIFEFNKMIFIYLITLLIFCLWLVRMIIYKKLVFRNTTLTIPLLVFLASQIISTYFSIDRHTSFFGYYGRFNGGLLSIICYEILYFAFVSNISLTDIRERIQYFLKFSLVTSFIVMLWGLPDKFGFDLSCKLFTGSFKTSCWTNEFQPAVRMFSTLGQPNWLGIYLVINILFALYFILSYDFRRRWLLYIYVFVGTVSVVFTQSRSAMLSYGLGLGTILIYIFMTKVYRKKRDEYFDMVKKIILPLILVIIVASIAGLATNKNMIIGQTTNNTQVKSEAQSNRRTVVTDSFAIRKIVWQGAYATGLKYPWFGSGVETFAYSFNFLRPVDHNMTSEWDFVYNKAHNEILNYFATTGIIGVLSYLILIGVVISRIKPILNESDEKKKLLGTILITSFAAITVSNFFGFSTTMINVYYYVIPACIVLLLSKSQENHIVDIEGLNIVQKVMLMIPFTIFMYGVSFLSFYYMADVHYARGENYRLIQEYDQALFYLYYADSLKSEHVYKDKISQVLAQKGFFDSYLNHTQNPMCPTPEGKNEQCFELAQKYNDMTLKNSSKNVYYYRSKARNNFLAYQISQDESDFDMSIKAISQAQDLAPTDPRYPYMKALFFIGRYDSLEKPTEDDKTTLKFRALGPANTAIKLKPDYKDAYITRGLAAEYVGDIEGARANFKYILEKLDPDDEQAKSELAKIDN